MRSALTLTIALIILIVMLVILCVALIDTSSFLSVALLSILHGLVAFHLVSLLPVTSCLPLGM
jgi:hypothetical protein